MKNDEWVKDQFGTFGRHKGRPSYRDVLIITSFIETVVRNEASIRCGKKMEFKKSLGVLGLDIDKNNEKKSKCLSTCQYGRDCLGRINVVRVQRNELLHVIIAKRLPQNHIDSTIKAMAANLEAICTKSKLIRNYFVNNSNYGFDPAALV